MPIMQQSVKSFYQSNFWIWLAKKLQNNNFNLNKRNISDYYIELFGLVDMDRVKYQLEPNKNFQPNTALSTTKKWAHHVLSLPKNPLIKHQPPTFINTTKINQLLTEMVPDRFIINVNRSYSAVINTPKPSESTNDPPLVITMKLNPTLIKGGGPRSLSVPLFLISGDIHQFHHYVPNLVETYIIEHYPDCN